MIRFLVVAVYTSRGVVVSHLVALIWLLLAMDMSGSGLIGPLVMLFCTVPAAIGRTAMTFDVGGFGDIIDAAGGYRRSLAARLVASVAISSPVLAAAVALCVVGRAFGSDAISVAIDAILCLGGCLLGSAALATMTHPNFPGSVGGQAVGFALVVVLILVSPFFQGFLANVDGPGFASSVIAVGVGGTLAMVLLAVVPSVLRRQ